MRGWCTSVYGDFRVAEVGRFARVRLGFTAIQYGLEGTESLEGRDRGRWWPERAWQAQIERVNPSGL